MEASVVWNGDVRFTGRTGSGHEVAIDGPPEHGGSDSGARPMELLLLGVGGCASFEVVDILRKGRQQVASCVAEIDAERAETEPKVFTKVHIRFRISGQRLSRNKVERAIRLTTEKYCSASILLQRAGVAISHDFELTEA